MTWNETYFSFVNKLPAIPHIGRGIAAGMSNKDFAHNILENNELKNLLWKLCLFPRLSYGGFDRQVSNRRFGLGKVIEQARHSDEKSDSNKGVPW